MTHLRMGLLLSAAVAFTACPAVPRAQDLPAVRTVQMVEVRGALQKTLDAKKAKQGDPVMVKLLSSATIPGAGAWPRNTVLSGRVDRVQASEKKSDSLIQVTFDKAVLKHGQVVAIKAMVMGLKPMVFPGDLNAQTNAEQSVSSAGPRAMNGRMRDLGADMPPSANPQPGHTPAYKVSRDAENQGSGEPWQATFLKGITLQSSLKQASSGTFRSSGKNVDIPSQTELDIAVGVLPADSGAK
ncbi:MAG: hypothetical protein ACRD3F_02205 [Acidobacteriaceae bacterium]